MSGLTRGPSPHECPFPKSLSSSLNIIYRQTVAECSSSTLHSAYLMNNFSVLSHQCVSSVLVRLTLSIIHYDYLIHLASPRR